MSDFGLTYDDYEWDLRRKRVMGYSDCAALSVVLYDSFLMLPREVQHIYRGPWSIMRTVYISFRLSAIACLLMYICTHETNFIPSAGCGVLILVPPLLRDVVLPATMKTLLVMRLCALWDYNRIVMVILGFVTAVELLAGALFVFLVGFIEEPIRVDAVPLHGCHFLFETETQYQLIHNSDLAIWVSRCVCGGIEVVLTLIKLYQFIQVAGIGKSTLRERLSLLTGSAPVIFVFYRDGTLFFIPIFVVNLLGLLAAYPKYRSIAIATSWSDWLLVVYYFCGTRLVINVREANCRLTKTLTSTVVPTIQFRATPQESTTVGGTG